MARKTVYIPDELIEQLGLVNDDSQLNLSKEFQQFLRARLELWAPPSRHELNPVRSLREEDIDEVIQLWNQVDDEMELTPMAERIVRRNLKSTLSESRAFCLVAEIDGQVVGFVTIGLIGHPVSSGIHAEIEELKVDRAHRRNGIGRALAIEAIRWIDNAAVRMIRVHVQAGNISAIRLFKSVGLEQDQVTLNRWP